MLKKNLKTNDKKRQSQRLYHPFNLSTTTPLISLSFSSSSLYMSFVSSLHSCYLITFLPSPGNRHTPKYLHEPSLVSSCIVRSSVKKPVGNRSSHTHTHTHSHVYIAAHKNTTHTFIYQPDTIIHEILGLRPLFNYKQL